VAHFVTARYATVPDLSLIQVKEPYIRRSFCVLWHIARTENPPPRRCGLLYYVVGSLVFMPKQRSFLLKITQDLQMDLSQILRVELWASLKVIRFSSTLPAGTGHRELSFWGTFSCLPLSILTDLETHHTNGNHDGYILTRCEIQDLTWRSYV